MWFTVNKGFWDKFSKKDKGNHVSHPKLSDTSVPEKTSIEASEAFTCEVGLRMEFMMSDHINSADPITRKICPSKVCYKKDVFLPIEST